MTYHLRSSQIPNIPILGYMYYLFEVALIHANLKHTFYISEKEKKFIRLVLGLSFKSSDVVVCHSFKFGYILKYIPSKIITDISIEDRDILTIKNYENFLYTLVNSSEVTENTLEALKVVGNYDWAALFDKHNHNL